MYIVQLRLKELWPQRSSFIYNLWVYLCWFISLHSIRTCHLIVIILCIVSTGYKLVLSGLKGIGCLSVFMELIAWDPMTNLRSYSYTWLRTWSQHSNRYPTFEPRPDSASIHKTWPQFRIQDMTRLEAQFRTRLLVRIQFWHAILDPRTTFELGFDFNSGSNIQTRTRL